MMQTINNNIMSHEEDNYYSSINLQEVYRSLTSPSYHINIKLSKILIKFTEYLEIYRM